MQQRERSADPRRPRRCPPNTATPDDGEGSVLGRRCREGQLSISPAMNFSTLSLAWSSGYWTGGDFMKYEDAEYTGPPMPRSLAILAARTASMITPAEFGESHTSRLYSMFSGTSPNARPSSRTYAHLRSSSHGT